MSCNPSLNVSPGQSLLKSCVSFNDSLLMLTTGSCHFTLFKQTGTIFKP